MSVRERVLVCKVIEQMTKQEGYSKKLGLQNKSTYRGEPVGQKTKGARSKKI